MAMWEGYYAKEPFDLRLTVLRLLRSLNRIAAITLAGTLLFGGGYYVKNVLLRGEKEYSVTSVYKVAYVQEPQQSGDYYINETSWNTLVNSASFLDAVQVQAQKFEETAPALAKEIQEMTHDKLQAAVSAKLPSDWHIPTTTVVTESSEKTLLLAACVEAAMAEDFTDISEQVQEIRVIDPAVMAQEVVPDVRPVRAFILSAILSGFFAVIFFLLKETGDDSIWLPVSLKRRYGLNVLGTPKLPGFSENAAALFQGKERIAVCAAENTVDVAAAVQKLQKAVKTDGELIPVNTPVLSLESSRKLREADGVLLLVKAGSHSGKPLEYVLEFLEQQDCKVTAAVLWEADEALIRAYYRLPVPEIFNG